MATYGTRDATRFKIGNVQYYTLVESSGPNKGQITIKSPTIAGNIGGVNADRTIGIIPLDNSFRPQAGSANNEEIEYFSSAAGQKAVKNHAVITAQKAGATDRDARQLIFPNTASPGSSKPGEQKGDPPGGTPDDSTDADGDGKPDEVKNNFEAGTPNGKIGLTETEQKTKFSPSGGLRYPEGLSSYQDRIQITALALMERTGATKNPDPTPPSTTPASGASSGTAAPPSQQKPGTPTGKPAPAPAAAPQKAGEKPTGGQPTQTDDQKTDQQQTDPPANLNFTFGDINYKKIDEPVLIAIQAPISDQNGVEWGSGGATAIEAAAYDAAIKATSGELSDAARSIYNTLKDVSTEQGQRIRRYLSGEAAGISNILARTDNIVLNPNLELLFSGPQLRTFTLTFKMSARNATESTQIKKIINYFKYHMAVRDDDASEKGASKSLFLRAPHAFEVKYILGKRREEDKSIEHPSISRIKSPCVLANMTVDYTPLGSYSTYADGSMVAYIINLQFQEMLPIYSSDYAPFAEGQSSVGSIGY